MSEKNGRKPDVEELRREIKQTRAELGETVQALAAKADVKARAKEQVEHTRRRARAQVHEATERVRGAAATAAAAASGRVRSATAHAGEVVREGAAQAGDRVRESGALDRVQDAGARVRRSPAPLFAVLAAGVALAGIILIVRGRRR